HLRSNVVSRGEYWYTRLPGVVRAWDDAPVSCIQNVGAVGDAPSCACGRGNSPKAPGYQVNAESQAAQHPPGQMLSAQYPHAHKNTSTPKAIQAWGCLQHRRTRKPPFLSTVVHSPASSAK